MTRTTHHRSPGRIARVTGLVAAAVLGLAACTSGGDPSSDPSASTSPTKPATAKPAPAPTAGTCHSYSFDQALAPTAADRDIACGKSHTSETYGVGELDTVVDGHLVAVDSEHVRSQVGTECAPRLQKFLGGDLESMRLSMLRAVWFTPTVEESDAGANWYRCDVIAIAGPDRLAPVKGSLKGILARPAGEGFAMCGTAAPDAPGFTRVPCRAAHSWRAISTFPLDTKRYPADAAAHAAGEATCEDAGRGVADDPLKFEWNYEWPTREQWEGGQTYGVCWAPA